jgi:hypothetical protein
MNKTFERFVKTASVALLAGCALAANAQDPAFLSWAKTPPMGWNSWDSFGAGVWESNVTANAEYMKKNLKRHGWDTITIDIQWYEPKAHTDAYRRGALLEMDAYGRLIPASNRFPMTAATRSFKPMGDYLHSKGLKFGLHLLRGIPRQAVASKTPVLGTPYTAADIAKTNSICSWNGDMYGVDMTKPGAQEYYDSVFALMASWGLDFVKVDDLSAPYHTDEIEAIRKAIDRSGRKIVFSTSPGETPVKQGAHVQTNANMWRVSNDFWDSWPALYEQFARLHNWTPYRAAGHWPDGDMLPLGKIRTWQTKGNWTRFTKDEQYTLMTLWSIARSPLIMGGDLPGNDEFTLSLLTNDKVLSVDQKSLNNHQVYNTNAMVVWVADVPKSSDKYVALFNAAPLPAPRGRRGAPPPGPATTNAPAVDLTQPREVSVTLAELGLSAKRAKVTDLWNGNEFKTPADTISATVNSHGAVLYRVKPLK